MLIASLVVFGLTAWPRIGVDLSERRVSDRDGDRRASGADPVSMESKVADPIEEALNTMSGIKVLRSVSLESVAQVILQFELEVNADAAIQDVRDRVSATMRRLPPGVEAPVIQKFDVGAAPIMAVALAGDLPIRELTALADDVVKERIQRIFGVGSVDIVGGRSREIRVMLDPSRLSGHGLGVHDIAGALVSQNLEFQPTYRDRIARARGERVANTDARRIADILIAGVEGARVRVRDVATVIDGKRRHAPIPRWTATSPLHS